MIDSRKRRWFRFSLRKLVIFTTIVCLYFACWIPTKTNGPSDVRTWHFKHKGMSIIPRVKAPLILESTSVKDWGGRDGSRRSVTERLYYLWFFGSVIEVPYAGKRVELFYVQPLTPRRQG